MRNYLVVIISILALAACVSTSAFAANSAAFNVTVSIATEASISVAGGPINFGTMGRGASSVSISPITVQNNGSGGNQTYSLALVNPADWTAVTTAPGVDEYRLSCAFDSDGSLTWNPVNHALTTTSTASTAMKFAGDETGAGVPFNASRHLYVKIETPSATSSASQKTIQVTITASVD